MPLALPALLLLSPAVLSVGVPNANAPASANDAYHEESDACEDAGCAGREAEQCGFENNAAVLEEVARGVVKAGTKSHWAHEVLLRAVSMYVGRVPAAMVARSLSRRHWPGGAPQ